MSTEPIASKFRFKFLCVFFLFLVFSFLGTQFFYKRKGFKQIIVKNYSVTNVPFVDVEIEGQKFLVMIDLGNSASVLFPESFIDKVSQKRFLKDICVMDISGKLEPQKKFQIPKLTIQGLDFFDIELNSESVEQSFSHVYLLEDSKEKNLLCGCIGWKFFSRFKILVDLGSDRIILFDKNEEFDFIKNDVEFVFTDLILDRNSLEFWIKQKANTFLATLDTGSTFNLVRDLHRDFYPLQDSLFDEKNYRTIKNLTINQLVLDPLQVVQVPLKIDLALLLGVDFFKTHQVFLDFDKKIVGIKKSS